MVGKDRPKTSTQIAESTQAEKAAQPAAGLRAETILNHYERKEFLAQVGASWGPKKTPKRLNPKQ